MEENSKKEILNNLEKLHDMVEDNDPNNQDQAVSEIMEEKVSDLYNELQGVDHVIWTGLNVEIGVKYQNIFVVVLFLMLL